MYLRQRKKIQTLLWALRGLALERFVDEINDVTWQMPAESCRHIIYSAALFSSAEAAS